MTVKSSVLHDESIVVNGLAQSSRVDQAFDAMLDGGITATNLTVAANEGFVDAMRRIADILRVMDQHPRSSSLEVVESVADIRRIKQSGRAGVILGFQNAQPIEDDLRYLEMFRRVGLRILQLTYQRRNFLGDGCGEPADGGLSLFGHQVVDAAEEMGVLVDLSHVGHRTTLEAIEHTSGPVVISHANLYSINPIPRNKKDEEIRALAAKGGVMGITSVSRLMSEHGRERGTDLSELIDQVEYVAELVGIDHVGIGLDIAEGMTAEDFAQRRETFLAKFPELKAGGDFSLEHYFTRGASSAAQFPSITEALVDRGFTSEEVKKVIGGNFMRVFEEVWND